MSTPKWFDPKITLGGAIQIGLLFITLIGAYYGIVSRVDGNDKDIAALQRVVTDIPGIKSDVLLLQNTITNRASARDAQLNTLTGRVDKVENTLDQKLDDLLKSVSTLQQDVAAMKATLTASQRNQ